MTQLLERAFQEAAKLPPDEQDVVANWLLAEMSDEQRWDALFAKSQDRLADLADEALAEHQSGLTQPLDPDRL